MKLSIEEILKKIEELDGWKTRNFISSLDLTPEQMEILANHENEDIRQGLVRNLKITEKEILQLTNDKNMWVRRELAKNPKITEKVMIKLSNDENADARWGLTQNPNLTKKIMVKLASDEEVDVKYEAFYKFIHLNSLKKEELESAYDLIRKSKYISRENFEETFDYIAEKFPELSKLAKMFKRIILKGKKDFK